MKPKALVPNQVVVTPYGGMVATLGNSELEFAAACVVRFQLVRGDGTEWIPIPIKDFFEVVKTDDQVKEWGKNPVWRPNILGLAKDGWIDGWVPGDMECVGTVTEKFIEAVSNPRVGPAEHHASRRFS